MNNKYIIDLSNIVKNTTGATKLSKLSESIVEPTQIIQDSIKRLAQVVNFNIDSDLFKSFKKIKKYLKRYGEIVDLFIDVMIEIDWPPPMDFVPQQMMKIIEFYNKNGIQKTEEAVSNTLTEYYDSEKINKMLSSWIMKDWILKRKPILQSIIKAHIQKSYWISIPAMLTQIEGIIVDGYCHKGWLGQDKLIRYIKKLYDLNSRTYNIDRVVKEILLNNILVNFIHGYRINSTLSRNAILHGADIEYGTAKNSLKTILLFNYLQRSFELLVIKDSKIYHKIGCYYLIRSDKEKKVYSSETQAKDEGKRPCKICNLK